MKRIWILWVTICLSLFMLIGSSSAREAIELHKVEVVNAFISDQYLTCSRQAYLVIELKNAGELNEVVHMQVLNEALGVNEFSPLFAIDAQEFASTTIPLMFAKEPTGKYTIEIALYFQNKVTQTLKEFTFKGCPSLPSPLGKQGVQEEKQSSEEKEEQKEPGIDPELGGQLVFMGGMVVVILILLMIYLFKVYIERTEGESLEKGDSA